MVDVSYIITVYNKSAFLPDVIAGLKSQTGDFSREFIFVDDHSSDNSLDVIRDHCADLENVFIYQQENTGPSIATNSGVGKARGTWIKLVDADDVLAPWCTQYLLNGANNLGLDVVFGRSGEYENDQGPKFRQDCPGLKDYHVFDDPLFTVLDKGYARVSHSLIRRSKFEEAGGCDHKIFAQDQSLFIRLSAVARLGYLKETVCSSPKFEPGRIMNNNTQVVHDATLSLAYFYAENPALALLYRRMIARKLSSRLRRISRQANADRLWWGLLYLGVRCGYLPNARHFISGCHLYLALSEVRKCEKSPADEVHLNLLEI